MSTTYRLFKIDGVEEDCEDFGQAVRYRGTVENAPDFFQLDEGHNFETDRIYTVCGNTFLMLKETRFKDNFDFYGDFTTHHGIFPDCGVQSSGLKQIAPTPANTTGCC